MNRLFIVLVVLVLIYLVTGLTRARFLHLSSRAPASLQPERTDRTKISVAQAIRIARTHQPGVVQMMSLEKDHQVPEYALVLENGNDRKELKIDAQSGVVLSMKKLAPSGPEFKSN